MSYFDHILSLLRGINVTNNILIVCSPRVSLGVTVASVTKRKEKKKEISVVPPSPPLCLSYWYQQWPLSQGAQQREPLGTVKMPY